ncbi:MAG: CsiV family protein, partial [Pseudomonadales bacterium]|nr:CsiV family protein [Pseudomonadales bacterium]
MIEQEALFEFSLEQGEQANNDRVPPNQHDEAGKYDNELEEDFFEDDSESDLNFDQFEASKTFVLKEHRKMKRAEIHFLDHPMLGLIIQITKYEIPEVLETVADELVADESETAEPEAIKTN